MWYSGGAGKDSESESVSEANSGKFSVRGGDGETEDGRASLSLASAICQSRICAHSETWERFRYVECGRF